MKKKAHDKPEPESGADTRSSNFRFQKRAKPYHRGHGERPENTEKGGAFEI
jgi:hypothetical protein